MDQAKIYQQIIKFGISETDARIITDCAYTRGSASWMNSDPVSKDSVRALLELNTEHDLNLIFSIKETSSGRYMWEVKVKK